MTTVLFASPRENGVTDAVTRVFLDGRDAVFFDLYALSPAPCTACNFCESEARCAKRDLDAAITCINRGEAFVCSVTGLAKVDMFQNRRSQLVQRKQNDERRRRNAERAAKAKKKKK